MDENSPKQAVKGAGPGDPAALPRLSGYTIQAKIYDGSICTVYKAYQERLGRTVALKLLPELPAPDDWQLARFNRSAYVNSRIVHDHIPVLYEVGTRDGYHFAALEYVHGCSLQDLLNQRGKLSERRAVLVGLQAAKALAGLHERAIVHRNFKPKNVLVSLDGQVHLVGLGLARCEGGPPLPELEGHPVGTPHYMSPEMIRGYEADYSCDLYALGVTLYVMATGLTPFRNDAPAAVMAQHLYQQPPPLNSLRPDLSPAYARMTERLLAKHAIHRPRSARQIVNELEELARRAYTEEGAVQAGPSGSPAPGAKGVLAPRQEPSFGRKVLLFAGAFGAVVVLGLPLLYLGREGYSGAAPEAPASPPSVLGSPAPASQGELEGTARIASPLPQAPASAAAVPVAPRSLPERFTDLLSRDLAFEQEPWNGVREWEIFLDRHPQLQPAMRAWAEQRITHFKRRVVEEALKRANPRQLSENEHEF